MKITIQGIFSIASADMIAIGCAGKQSQTYELPEGFNDVAIEKELKEVVTVEDGSLLIAGNTSVLVLLSPRFGRAEVVRMTSEDAKLFVMVAQSDPDVQKFIDQARAAFVSKVDSIFNELIRILDFIPENGPTAELVGQLEKLKWEDTLREILNALKLAYPGKWDDATGLLSKDTKSWLADKM